MLNSDSRRRGASESLTRHAFPVVQAKSTKKESILPDIIYTALKVISKVSEGCPFPPIVLAAQLAVDIWDKVIVSSLLINHYYHCADTNTNFGRTTSGDQTEQSGVQESSVRSRRYYQNRLG